LVGSSSGWRRRARGVWPRRGAWRLRDPGTPPELKHTRRVEPTREFAPLAAAGSRACVSAGLRSAWRRHARGVWPRRGRGGFGIPDAARIDGPAPRPESSTLATPFLAGRDHAEVRTARRAGARGARADEIEDPNAVLVRSGVPRTGTRAITASPPRPSLARARARAVRRVRAQCAIVTVLSDAPHYSYQWIHAGFVPADLLEEMAALYSTHYGTWGAGSPKRFQPIRLSTRRIQDWLTHRDARLAYASLDGKLVGYAIAVQPKVPGLGGDLLGDPTRRACRTPPPRCRQAPALLDLGVL